MSDKKENKHGFLKGCGCGCLSVIILSILIVVFAYGCSGGKVDPEDQAKNEVQIIENHYNEIMTDMANLNVTGHGDFINMMTDQVDFAQVSIEELNKDYGEESEVINLCKQAWSDVSSIATAAKDGLANNDQGCISMIQTLQAEYETTIQQIKSMINE